MKTKYQLVRLVAGAALVLIATANSAMGGLFNDWSQWQNSLAPSGTGTQITVVSGGSANFTIVLPASPTGPESKAASDLQYWLQEMTGVQLGIINEPTSPPGGNSAISIGRTNLLHNNWSAVETIDYGRDGYCIGVVGGNLYLLGGTVRDPQHGGVARGPINAVYALLEEDLGCRWYTPDHPRIPSFPNNLTFTPMDRTFKPQFEMRDPFILESMDEEWSLRNRTNGAYATVRDEWGANLSYGGWTSGGNPGLFSHTLTTQLLRPEVYFNAHPDWYMLDDQGQRIPDQICPTAGTAMTDQIETNLRNIYLDPSWSPYPKIISISQGDWGKVCQHSACQTLIASEGSNFAPLLQMINTVAQHLEMDYPNLRISAMAYLDCADVPHAIRPRSNVMVRVCNALPGCNTPAGCIGHEGALSHPLTLNQNLEIGTLLPAWTAVHDTVYVWDYNVNFCHMMAPLPNISTMAQNILFAKNSGAESYMTQGQHTHGCSERADLRAWVFAKLMWDPNRNYADLIKDFTWGHYGAGASAISNYNESVRTRGITYASDFNPGTGGLYYGVYHPFLSSTFLNTSNNYFGQAETAVGANWDVLQRIERMWLSIMYVRLERGMADNATLNRFRNIAVREGVTLLSWTEAEGTKYLDDKLTDWGFDFSKVPTAPNPSDGNDTVDPATNPQLTWTSTATSYDVYFGTTNPPPFALIEYDNSFDPGTLDPGQTYYWTIHAYWNAPIGVHGDVWSFTTIGGPPDTPDTPTYTNYCGYTRLTRGTPPADVTWYWQTSPTGTSTSNSAVNWDVTSAGTYYLRARNDAAPNLWSTNSASVTATVNSVPAAPTNGLATPSAICLGSSSNLTASVGGAVIDWYTGSCGGTLVHTGSPYNVSPGSTTTYYARARNSSTGCESSACQSVAVTVLPVPVATISAPLGTGGGTIRVSSNLSGNQTFYLRDASCAAIDSWTGSATYHDFTGLADGTYRGQVAKDTCLSACSSSVTLTTRSPDFDDDSDVDQEDFGHLQACLTGEGIAQNHPDCQDAKLDDDTDVDAADFAIFLSCMSGPNTPANPSCVGP